MIIMKKFQVEILKGIQRNKTGYDYVVNFTSGVFRAQVLTLH